eukprot:163551-Rhodomonas_salina.2
MYLTRYRTSKVDGTCVLEETASSSSPLNRLNPLRVLPVPQYSESIFRQCLLLTSIRTCSAMARGV